MLTYSQWTERLGQHFFNESKAGQPVTFFVDDEVLAHLEGSGDGTLGAESLAQAVRPRLSPDSWGRRFARIDEECGKWKVGGAAGYPPSLPLLAVAVLAGTHMAAESGISSANYWKRFRDIVELHGEHDLKNYGDVFPGLWHQLAWWLDEKNEGGLGTNTIDEDPWPTIIGYALSQSLFRESDRQHLPELFQRIGLVPGEQIDSDELLQYFKAWAPKSALSHSARLMAANEHYEQRLVSILRDEAARFDGTLRDAAGRRIANLSILFNPFPAPVYRIVAERPETFPERADFGDGHFSTALSAFVDGWYQETWALNEHWLSDGLRLTSGAFVLQLRPGEVVPFTRNSVWGCWSSVMKLEPSEPHLLLVADERREEVSDYLGRHALSGWKTEPQTFAPSGWTLFKNVVIEEAPASAPEGSLAVLMPVVRERPTFRGGLALDPSLRLYLYGGEPDLWLPSLMAADMPVLVDGARVASSPGARVSLRDLGLPSGTHDVDVGAAKLSFRSIPSLKEGEVEGTGTVMHRLRRDDVVYVPESIGAATSELQGVAAGEVAVAGAHISGAQDDLPPARQTVLLPAGATDYLLLGARAGEVLHVREPERPKWLDDVAGKKLFRNGFELQPPFPAVWVMYRRFDRAVARLAEPSPPEDRAVDAADEAVAEWKNAFASVPEFRNGGEQLWAAYQRLSDDCDCPTPSAPVAAEVAEQSGAAPEAEDADASPQQPDAYELLLHWASELGSGSWGSFRNAHDWLFNAGKSDDEQVKATNTIHTLSMLGHIEIDWQANRWAVAPAAITILPSAGGHAALAGSRTGRMARRFMSAAMAGTADLFADIHPQEWGPDAVFLAAGSDRDVASLADTVGIHYEVCVSERLAALLPSLDTYLRLGEATPGARGYGVERFDTKLRLFRSCRSDAEPGFYRYDVPGRPELRFVDGHRYYRVDRALGVYAELRRVGEMVLRWEADTVNGMLFVPFRAQLPTLHARTAVLCCGLAPLLQRSTWDWVYRNVPRETAEQIASSLSQVLP